MLLNACSQHQIYPDNWTPLPNNPPVQCSIPTGLYLNQSAANPDLFSKLSYALGFTAKTEHVRLTLNDDYILTTEAVQHGKVLETKIYAKGEEQPICKNGWLLFKSRGWEPSQAGFGYQASVTGLLFHNNYLVIKESESFAGWAYIMPFAGRGSDWDRFRYLGDLNLKTLRDEAEELRKRGYLNE